LREELTGGVYTVFVSLLVESRNSKAFQYILEIIREPGFEIRMTDAAHWKFSHLDKFVNEAHALLNRVHEIYMDAHNQVPAPPTKPASFASIFSAEFNKTEAFDYPAYFARIRAIERDQEEKLLDDINDWQSRAADFLDLYIGAGQRDQFVNSSPSIEDGFNRVEKSPLRRIRIGSKGGLESAPPELPYWTLGDAVMARLNQLGKVVKQL
jgi:hypothetical protein